MVGQLDSPEVQTNEHGTLKYEVPSTSEEEPSICKGFWWMFGRMRIL